MNKKKKYYVVWQGHKEGIYDSWKSCKEAIFNYPQAQYKSFETKESAIKAFDGVYADYVGKKVTKPKLSKTELDNIGQPNLYSIAVDAASSGNPGKMEYRGVDTQTQKQLFHQGPFLQGTNNIGEFLALVHGLAFLKQHNSDRLLYTDSRIAMGWVKQKRCKTKLSPNPKNEKVMKLIIRAENWLKTNTYQTQIVKWETKAWGEIPADFGRK